MALYYLRCVGTINKYSGAGFSNDLRETLTYSELLKHESYPILRNFRLVCYSNNFIKCLYYRARWILIHNILKLDKIGISKIHRQLRSPVNRSRIRPLSFSYIYINITAVGVYYSDYIRRMGMNAIELINSVYQHTLHDNGSILNCQSTSQMNAI